MGKLAKQRRFQKWKDAKRIAVLTTERDHFKSVGAFNERRANECSDQLARIVSAIQRITTSSAALPVETTIPSYHGHARVRLNDHRPTLLSVDACQMSRSTVEELTQFLLYDVEMHEQLCKTLHFRVLNDANGRSFTVGYAVTREMLRCFRERDHLVRTICEQFGAQIWQQLFGKEGAPR